MKLLLSPREIVERQEDVRKRFLHVLRLNPMGSVALAKKIGVSYRVLRAFADGTRKLQANSLYKILNYIELWEDVELY